MHSPGGVKAGTEEAAITTVASADASCVTPLRTVAGIDGDMAALASRLVLGASDGAARSEKRKTPESAGRAGDDDASKPASKVSAVRSDVAAAHSEHVLGVCEE